MLNINLTQSIQTTYDHIMLNSNMLTIRYVKNST